MSQDSESLLVSSVADQRRRKLKLTWSSISISPCSCGTVGVTGGLVFAWPGSKAAPRLYSGIASAGPSVVSVMCVPLATALFGGAVLGSTADERNGRVHSESQDTEATSSWPSWLMLVARRTRSRVAIAHERFMLVDQQTVDLWDESLTFSATCSRRRRLSGTREASPLPARHRGCDKNGVFEDLVNNLAESLGDTNRSFGWRFDEEHAPAAGPGCGLGARDNDVAVDLVADEQFHNLFAATGRVRVDLLQPSLEIIECRALGHVVHESDTLRTAIVRRRQRSETLLARRIPECQFQRFPSASTVFTLKSTPIVDPSASSNLSSV